MRVATCTPVDFVADPQFFGRDSGLMCRGLQLAGHECKVIMPGKSSTEDAPDLLRASSEELRDPEWWKAQQLGLVLIYAWGDPAYLEIALAIRQAEIPLVQNLDSAGIESPHANFKNWWISLSGMIAGPQPLKTKIRLVGRGLRDLNPALYERRRLRMMDESDFLAAVSPPAARSIREYAEGLGCPQVAAKVITVPHPVSREMTYRGEPKQNRVICVGRWQPEDHHQKDPKTLIQVLTRFLQDRPDWSAEIIGRGAPRLSELLEQSSRATTLQRLTFTEHLDRSSLRDHYASSRILLCPSRFESFHISSAEALCCGCSVVVANHPLLASTAWFTTRNSGTLAKSRNPSDLLEGLIAESFLWESHQRTADEISSSWVKELRCDFVAKNLMTATVIQSNI